MILKHGIDFTQFLFTEHSLFYFVMFVFPEFFLSIDAQFFFKSIQIILIQYHFQNNTGCV